MEVKPRQGGKVGEGEAQEGQRRMPSPEGLRGVGRAEGEC